MLSSFLGCLVLFVFFHSILAIHASRCVPCVSVSSRIPIKRPNEPVPLFRSSNRGERQVNKRQNRRESSRNSSGTGSRVPLFRVPRLSKVFGIRGDYSSPSVTSSREPPFINLFSRHLVFVCIVLERVYTTKRRTGFSSGARSLEKRASVLVNFKARVAQSLVIKFRNYFVATSKRIRRNSIGIFLNSSV